MFLFKLSKKTYTINEAHKAFAAGINGRVSQLLQKKSLAQDEKDELLYAVNASAYHWLRVGTVIEKLRAEWLITKVHSELGYKAGALRHAQRCFELTEANKTKVKDFDIAYSLEAMARAHALNDEFKEANTYYQMALDKAKQMTKDEDKKLFMGDLKGGNWNGFSPKS